jgi:hypothetical protein
MSKDTKSEQNFPSILDFCVLLPLYAEHKVMTGSGEEELWEFITADRNLDFFCVDCQQSSVFIGGGLDLEMQRFKFDLRDRIFTRRFVCSRIHNHFAYFHFRLKNGVLTKIGQSPSMADLSESELRPYRKVLDAEEYRELTRAVGLASHGVGIGSFVYLRRIFERLVDEARVSSKTDVGWDDDAFVTARMDDKIELLRSRLPPFLVEHRKLYSILSVGIHSLTENDCLAAFPVVRAGIELILDQKVAAKQQQEKMDEARKRIQGLQQKIKSP